MRSVFVSMLALALAVLLCACLSTEPVWETVDDDLVCAAPDPAKPYAITFCVPEDALEQTLSADTSARVYLGAGGGYEIVSDFLACAEPMDAVQQLTGFAPSQLELVTTTRFGMPEYQFAWSASGDEGARIYRAAILSDGSYCYTLCFSSAAGLGGTYDSIQLQVFSSFGLYGDENF